MRFRSCLTLLTASALALCALSSHAAPPPGDAASIARFKVLLAQKAPAVAQDVKTVVPVDAMGGVYELDLTGNKLIYVDPQARSLMIGQLVDLASQRNLTQDRIAELSRFDFNSMPFKLAIREVRGNGQRRVAMFEDPNCHYCAQMEASIKDVTNVTIYHFIIPILGADSVVKTKAIWCSRDQAQAWHTWMLQRQAPISDPCTVPLEELATFSSDHNIAGTPTVVFEDGKRVSGAMPRDAFEQQLTASSKAMKK